MLRADRLHGPPIQVRMHRVCFSKGQSCGAFAVIFEIQAIRFRSGDQHPEVIDRLTCDVPDLEAAKTKAKDLVMTVSWRSQKVSASSATMALCWTRGEWVKATLTEVSTLTLGSGLTHEISAAGPSLMDDDVASRLRGEDHVHRKPGSAFQCC